MTPEQIAAMPPRLYFVFDVESVGLHGEGYAYGYVVVTEQGMVLDAARCSCNPGCASGDAGGRKWIADNCPDIPQSEPTPKAVRARFVDEWIEWRGQGAVMVADCPWPVESRFLADCVRDFSDMQGPYPLIDVASVVLAAGGDPLATFDRLENELPNHDPLADARQSARVFIEHLRKIEARDILAENARLVEALEAIIQRAKTADFFREKHNISHMGMISMSDPLLIAAQAALAARGK